jgi:stress response protein YsnF
MNYEKIVTLYDTAEHAEAAKRSLESAGFAPSEISLINSKTLGVAGDKLNEPGLWHRLFGRDIKEYEATVYGRSVAAGGVVLTIRVPEAEASRAMSILNAHRAVDLSKRAEQEGLMGTTPAAVASKPATVQTAPTTTTTTTTTPTAVAAGAVAGEEVLALAEEQINVGKRLVQGGTTRIRRFVTETPVEAQVTLHEEHARVLRRASADPNFIRNIDWTDKTIEITETAEEPVVTKSVHITEEVVIQREGSDHVKTLRDKVRRQQVEVERVAEPVAKR